MLKEGKTMTTTSDPFVRRLDRKASCPGGWEAHEAHLDVNGECPWCGDLTPAMAKQLNLAEFGDER